MAAQNKLITMDSLSPMVLVLRQVFESCIADDAELLNDPAIGPRIQAAHFNERIPEFLKIYPDYAKALRRLEKETGFVTWEEFAEHCLKGGVVSKHEGVSKTLVGSITVLGVAAHLMFGEEAPESHGQPPRTTKDRWEPKRACEMGQGVSPPLLPWEACHRIEWRIENLAFNKKRQFVSVRGLEILPGNYMSSPPFKAGGVSGVLRFWPNGYFNTSQRRERGELDLGGLQADSWCGIGVFVESGASLRIRLFVGDRTSSFRDVYVAEGCGVQQVWTPQATEPPEGIEQGLVVGIEIARNSRQTALREIPSRAGMTRDTLVSKVFMPSLQLKLKGAEACEMLQASPRLSRHWLINPDTLPTLPAEALRRPKPLLKGAGNGGNTKGKSPRLNFGMTFEKDAQHAF